LYLQLDPSKSSKKWANHVICSISVWTDSTPDVSFGDSLAILRQESLPHSRAQFLPFHVILRLIGGLWQGVPSRTFA
jgi:hypothetical protein